MSILGRLAIVVLRTMRGKRDLADGAALDAAIARRRQIDRHQPPKSFRQRYRLRIDDVGGHPCYTLAPRSEPNRARILYLHGGCYTYEITSYHWSFLAKLVDALGCTISIPIYPLAPEHDHRASFVMLEALADSLLIEPEHLTIMGDSAGGGLALALAQQLKRAGKPQPRALVLVSPWLDLTLSDPAIDALEASDPMLGRGGLIAAGRLWAGEIDPRDPRVSPIYGDLDGLAPILLLVGGCEILLPDARRLRDRLQVAGSPMTYVEEPGMFHVWPLVVVLPEARRALRTIVELISAAAPERV